MNDTYADFGENPSPGMTREEYDSEDENSPQKK